jgi:hypothetical protein
VIVNPAEFGQLLKDPILINSLYQGTTSPVKEGRFPTILGFEIISSSVVSAGTVYFVAKRAVTVAMRRDIKVEEYSYPDINDYGLVASYRKGIGAVLPEAIAIMTV